MRSLYFKQGAPSTGGGRFSHQYITLHADSFVADGPEEGQTGEMLVRQLEEDYNKSDTNEGQK